MRVYPVKKHPTIKNLVHLDAYRIKQANELLAIGIKNYLNKPDTVTVIEWADIVEGVLPKDHFTISFESPTETARIISIPDTLGARLS